ncbi:MAG: VWA-like domain-containing protein [Gammaproteobacteria bacterium]|nr:VWA-like domain-containing protein [Gammaproteobacteria bacterium]
MAADINDIELKLTAARTRLIIEKPFLGALVLRLPAVAANPNWCETTATDARKIYYNPAYIDALDMEETQFALAHEALHCALSHFARRGHRDKRKWDIACDLAINPLLHSEGFKLPAGALMLDGFEGMTAEEIYPSIEDSFEEECHDKHVYDSDSNIKPNPEEADRGEGSSPDQPSGRNTQRQPQSGHSQQSAKPGDGSGSGAAPQPLPLSQTERENLNTQWQQRLAGAAQQAMQAGKLSGAMARLVDYLLQPQLSWRSVLAHYMSSIARDDYSYARPSTRRGDPAIYPSLRSGQINVTVALDTSGSISDDDMRQFVSEIDAIKSQVRARVTLHACDAKLVEGGPWVYEPWEEFRIPGKFIGGGGTEFAPVFDWIERSDFQPDLLIYFTDAKGNFPEQQPPYPVIWLIKGKESAPWGVRVQLN